MKGMEKQSKKAYKFAKEKERKELKKHKLTYKFAKVKRDKNQKNTRFYFNVSFFQSFLFFHLFFFFRLLQLNLKTGQFYASGNLHSQQESKIYEARRSKTNVKCYSQFYLQIITIFQNCSQ